MSSSDQITSYAEALARMGQYWKLINIDRKEELHNDGGLKLWEMLMNGCLEQLVDLIRKPNWIPVSAGTKVHLLLAKSKR